MVRESTIQYGHVWDMGEVRPCRERQSLKMARQQGHRPRSSPPTPGLIRDDDDDFDDENDEDPESRF